MNSELTLNGEYCEFRIKNILGKVLISSYFGDIYTERLWGGFWVKSNRSDIYINELRGKGILNAEWCCIRDTCCHMRQRLGVCWVPSEVRASVSAYC